MRFTTESIDAAILRTGGRSSGFDYLRMILSASVLFWHAFRISYAGFPWDGWYRPVVALILPMFFALSGFLVSGSLVRVRSIHEFVMLRAIRIGPALAVEITISALIIGTLFTTLPLGEYFTHNDFWSYFRNIIGDIHFYLPGVFKDNPMHIVNASLWTIPYELECYLLIIVLWIIGAIRKPVLLLVATVALMCMLPLFDSYRGQDIDLRTPIPGRILLVAFLFGVVLYFFREKVLFNGWLALTALVVSLGLLMFTTSSYFIGPSAAYLTVWLGMRNPPRPWILSSGDYSYGLYLYAFPVQQMVCLLMPPELRVWWINASLSLLIAGGCAMFSWHVVEKPILARSKDFVAFSDGIANRLGIVPRTSARS